MHNSLTPHSCPCLGKRCTLARWQLRLADPCAPAPCSQGRLQPAWWEVSCPQLSFSPSSGCAFKAAKGSRAGEGLLFMGVAASRALFISRSHAQSYLQRAGPRWPRGRRVPAMARGPGCRRPPGGLQEQQVGTRKPAKRHHAWPPPPPPAAGRLPALPSCSMCARLPCAFRCMIWPGDLYETATCVILLWHDKTAHPTTCPQQQAWRRAHQRGPCRSGSSGSGWHCRALRLPTCVWRPPPS